MYIVNDFPANTYRDAGPPSTPTLKLARHGGGTVGGPVRVYTSNPFTFVHQGGEVTAHETVHLSHIAQALDRSVLMRSQYGNLHPAIGGHPGTGAPYLQRPGMFAWPDTSSGAGRAPSPDPGGPPANYPRGAATVHGTTRTTVGGYVSHQGMMARGEVVSLRPGLPQQGLAPQRPGPFGARDTRQERQAPSARSQRGLGAFLRGLWRA